MKRLFLLACALIFAGGARDQCVPGPFEYDDDGQFTDQQPFPGGFNNCFDPSCPDFVCERDDECRGFLGGDARCESGTCISRATCFFGQGGNACFGAGETCAYDASSPTPLDQGVCKPVSPTAAPPGEPCSLADDNVNPCDGGAYCLPTNDEEQSGICVVTCNQGECGAGFNCAPTSFNGFGGQQVCMPACNLDAPDCGDPRFVCVQSPFTGSCTPDSGACVLVGCESGACRDLCTTGDDCSDGTFCIETAIPNCRVDGPTQTFSVCSPPSQQGQPCTLTEPGSCANGLACSPFTLPPTCVQQSSTPAADGDSCDPNDTNVNRCTAGAFCARTVTGGVCQRFCDGDDDCALDQGCVRGNVVPFFTDEAQDGLTVCANRCNPSIGCADGLSCDIDGALCSATNDAGFCVTAEDASACRTDDDCFFDGTICGGDFRCTLPEDACLAQECVLTDPSSCPQFHACSPFRGDVPRCVPQDFDVAAVGEQCNPGEGLTAPCEAGAICAQSVCMRLCEDDVPCQGAQQCVRGNVLDPSTFEISERFRLYDLKVCAEPCNAGSSFCNSFTCDIDDGAPCSGAGFCLPFESAPLNCASDADCSKVPGASCDFAGQCLPPADQCTP